MSWTNECTESSFFKVKDTQEVKAVLEQMGFDVCDKYEEGIYFGSSEGTYFDENTEVVLSIKPVNDKNLIGIISDYANDSVDLEEVKKEYGEQIMVLSITEYLQDELLDNKQYIAVTCAGFESRLSGSHSPFGDVIIITKYDVKFIGLAHEVDKYLKEKELV